MRLLLTPVSVLAATAALAQEPQVVLSCKGETTIIAMRARGGETSESFKQDPKVYLSGDDAIVVWPLGTTKLGRVIRTPEAYFLLFPDPALPRGGRLVRKEASINRLTGVFVDVAEIEAGRQRNRVEHASTCEPLKSAQEPKF